MFILIKMNMLTITNGHGVQEIIDVIVDNQRDIILAMSADMIIKPLGMKPHEMKLGLMMSTTPI